MCPLIPCQVNKSGGPPVGDLLAHPGVGVLGKTRFAQASLIDSGTAGIGNSTLTVHWRTNTPTGSWTAIPQTGRRCWRL